MDALGILEALESHALSLGVFEKVGRHEPKSAPATTGMTCAIWSQTIRPATSSGLSATTGVLDFSVRIYTSMLAEPADAIDPAVMAAVDALMTAYLGDFELGSNLNVRCIDIRGMEGKPVSAEAGYLNQDGKLYRVMTLTVPVIVNDCWAEAA